MSCAISLRFRFNTIPFIPAQARLSKNLLHLYYDGKISADDAPVNVRSMFCDAQQNSVVDEFLASASITSTNAWNMGGHVAKHVLDSFLKRKKYQICELERDVEVYLSLVVRHTPANAGVLNFHVRIIPAALHNVFLERF
jgi:hypothetical protein